MGLLRVSHFNDVCILLGNFSKFSLDECADKSTSDVLVCFNPVSKADNLPFERQDIALLPLFVTL